MRAEGEGVPLLFPLPGRDCSLGGLGLNHALLELVHAAGGIDELLLAGVKRMAHVANTDNDHRFRGACFDYVATGATNLRIYILRMYIFFHKRLDTIPPAGQMTSRNCSQRVLFGSLHGAGQSSGKASRLP